MNNLKVEVKEFGNVEDSRSDARKILKKAFGKQINNKVIITPMTQTLTLRKFKVSISINEFYVLTINKIN